MLKINILHNFSNKVSVISYDNNYNVLFEKEINKKDILVIDLDVEKFIKFKNDKLESEFIILNNMIKNINLTFNTKTKALDVSFSCDSNRYGKVKTIKLKDKLNLPHSKRHKKRIHILLPHNFDENKIYNLLIMIDGQNIYDINKVGKYTKLNDPYGGWQIETTLQMLYEKYNFQEFIVAGIETTGNIRMKELTLPASFGSLKPETEDGIANCTLEGTLDKTNDFIIDTVIPYLKQNYNISDFIGIGGSSAGGATSQYVGLKNNDSFKFILSLSPAMAIWDDDTISDFYESINLKNNKDLPYYFYNIGNRKGLEEYLNQLNVNTIEMLKKYGYEDNKIISYVEPNGEHNEIMWRYATAYALEQIVLKEKKQ